MESSILRIVLPKVEVGQVPYARQDLGHLEHQPCRSYGDRSSEVVAPSTSETLSYVLRLSICLHVITRLWPEPFMIRYASPQD